MPYILSKFLSHVTTSMSPRICSCTLCGWVVVDAPGSVSWLNQFRGVTSSPDGVILTGVGLYDDPARGAFIAPVDHKRRWDDPTYDSTDEDQFGAMGFPPVDGRHGFIFHDACWGLLEKAFHPSPVPLSRLSDVCESLPFPLLSVGISWGHDYGGASIVDNEHHFPFEDRFFDRDYMDPDPVLSANPYEADEAHNLLTEAPEEPPSPQGLNPNTIEPEQDNFYALPEELRSAIAIFLPTLDVLNLRLASRSFWTIFNSQQFWASRFKHKSDRSWLLESQDGAQPRDWRWLLQNRIRVWNLAQKVVAALDFQWVDSGSEPSQQQGPTQRLKVSGDLWERPSGPHHSHVDKGCLLRETYRLTIPEDLSTVSVWSIPVGDILYIAGLKFATATGDVRQIGYRTTVEQSVEISDIIGFKLAVGERGIQALQCINQNSHTSHWLGSPGTSLKTMRFNVGERINYLDIGFDGCKVVSLAIFPQSSSIARLAQDDNRLRNMGLWYPEVPGPDLCLNEASFAPRELYLDGFKPLFWTSFGGPGGAHLRKLNNLRVVLGPAGIRRIDFTYNTPELDREFGCQMPGDVTKEINFKIDGAGGELITAVEILQENVDPKDAYAWMVEEGFIAAFNVSTNRGRSCFFSIQDNLPSNTSFLVAAGPGEAITGFYGIQHSHEGSSISALGVISEAIEGS
ncbi:F-box domain-containing protein [Colletotrichum scovillei]|uniref:F-box domain-containing protein n=1 Tax=Colletotrichum scovillei TaxID=1209932 RepID=A0A9P7RD81_9PEZI|nr:F-box domain-containing protein [Colletotrichum scovillei]KAG7071790.1 F-box domain-containing protein [Colletotrichum scovillei]KAG7080075.1 F-box domain-containing protein [Colletotrichum scovillei]